jgi:glycosyltransferase involved in cell wall biosynthesis
VSSPYLAPPLQRTLAGAARRAGVGRHLHRVHDLAPRLTERALALMRRVSSRPRDLAGAMDRRADALSAAMRHVQVFLAPTNFARQRALELGIPAAAVRTLPLGVVAEGGRPRRSGTRPRLGYVGTLAPHKGVHVLLQAFRGIAERGVTLDLYGSLSVHPSYAAELRRMAAGDERIRFHGAFPEGAQTSVFDALDALVLPSMWWENSPLTVLEALAAGRPVVASATGGVPEIVEDGDTGLLVPPGDVVALRRALVDVATGRSLGSARGPVRLKTVREGAQELLALYGSLVAAPTHVESA